MAVSEITEVISEVISEVICCQVYIQYMKFARRAEGIKAARMVFKQARDDTRVQYHVFIAAALLEYYCSKVRRPAGYIQSGS